MYMNFIQNEHNILEFWRKNKIFEKLRRKNKGKKRWSFLDGPITANNPMGVHHAWGRTYKDLYQRYKAMQGFDQRFQNGFDCQGLWVEVEVEKELGFKSKKDIEKYGIGKFVEKCKERVRKYSKIQTEQSIRLGQWMDWENSYYTMSDENNYSIWHFLKKCHSKGFLYKGRDVVPWCPRCGTAISQHEILSEEYKEITHRAVFFRLPVAGKKKTFFLAWTTTPWTLPANVALAVHPDLDYVEIEDSEENIYILLKSKSDLISGGKIIKEIKGKDLAGLRYGGLFDDTEAVKSLGLQEAEGWHKVVLWQEVTEEEGTGIVHIAPGCGQEDFQLAKEFGLPVINPTDDESRYKSGFDALSGEFVGSETVREKIFSALQRKGLLFKAEDYRHRYPTCWRCKTELIFRLVDEWYIKMDALRKPLMESAKKVKWVPSFGLERELDWLKNMKDWLISKKRYWGLALPIFECAKCGTVEVIGSKKELEEKAVAGWEEFEGKSPHRPWIDKVKIRCPQCGELVSRIPDVGNPWLDAGIVPFSTITESGKASISGSEGAVPPSYFRGAEYWRKWFPADFVCESFPGQFKNWFYSILAMSQVLEGCPPSKTIFGYATVVDEKGEEMHKSKGNAIWFNEAVEEIGADVMRWMYARQNPAYNLRFGFNVAREIKRKLLVLENSYKFFETYSSKKNFSDFSLKINPSSLLDKWVLSRFNCLIKKATTCLDNIEPSKAVLAIEDFFINDLSLWYIRRSRRRFQNPKREKEKKEAERTLYSVLLELTKLIAPVMPFFAEQAYQKLRANTMPESVHLCDWPEANDKLIDKELEEKMDKVRMIVGKALAKRTEAGIKVRQPLSKLKIKGKSAKEVVENLELAELVKEEINIKEIVYDAKISGEIELDSEITSELEKEGCLRELIHQIQVLRKKEGLLPKNKIKIHYWIEGNKETIAWIKNLLKENKEKILNEVNSKELISLNEENIVDKALSAKMAVKKGKLLLSLEKVE